MKIFECLTISLGNKTKTLTASSIITSHINKIFFAHNQQNYAHIVPVYLEEMYVLREEEPEVWQFLCRTLVLIRLMYHFVPYEQIMGLNLRMIIGP